MKMAAYTRVVEAIDEWIGGRGTVAGPGPSRDTSLVEMLLRMAAAERTSFEVVRSIYSQQIKAHARAARARTRGSATRGEAIAKAYADYAAGGHSLRELAVDYRIAPFTMACSVLEAVIDLEHPMVKAAGGGVKSKAKFSRRRDLVKDLLPGHFAAGAPAAGRFPMVEWCEIDPVQLHSDVVECILGDDTAGPLVDRIRHTIGLEYEYLLQEQLRQLNVSFLSEDIQKTNRHVRTPDCALITPVEVHGHLCHWVESKASFGDRQTLEDNEREQFHSYVERVGPGVVIYWFDFIEDHPEVDLQEWRDRGILVVSRLPDEVVPRPDVPVKLPASFTDQTRLLKSRAKGGDAPVL
eukprot:CAMPEP_0206304826 /NCGR_PEP_ID=MMETSP0106_2-20121207/9947_1 /ASSEMBLY_ACC=CAM_ASM_000206 /TAXON_ID=81532 /ORGANISM="Acanthoeca-like sp., Strain 10tr" /LENGTH=351 /DNA_ID=CAMNT_0053735653 /DNA_START=128 /DNA_END=1182 /DNA_ORIENTATION=-